MSEINNSEFVQYALKYFDVLKWKPAHPEDCSGPHIIAYGNIDVHGCGCICVIDPVAQLFKIEQHRRSANEILKSQCVVHYDNDKVAIYRFEHYMDKTGMFYKEAWLGG